MDSTILDLSNNIIPISIPNIQPESLSISNDDVSTSNEILSTINITSESIDISNNELPLTVDTSNNELSLTVDTSNNELSESIDMTNSELNELQKKVFDSAFNSTLNIIKDINNNKTISDYLIVSLTIAEVIKSIEKSGLPGCDKKTLAIYMGKKIIENQYADKKEIIAIYDLTVDSILEKMIDVSRNLNVTIQNKIKDNEFIKPKSCCIIQ